MKKTLCILLSLLLALCLLGCYAITPVEFYYQQRSDPQSLPESVISAESREVSGHTDDLTYLLSLYLQGPLDAELKSPFPAGCKLVSAVPDGDTLCITLDSTFVTLENTQLTIACACLAKTCFSLTDAVQVQIQAAAEDNSKAVDVIIGIDSLILEDDGSSIPQPTTEETQ